MSNKNQKAKIGRINYINVMPLYYYLDQIKNKNIEIIFSSPSVLNNLMANEKLDISPVSSVALAKHHKEWLILPDLSISCFGEVMSVKLVSKLPFEKLHNKKVIISDESATSADLIKLIFAKKKISPIYIKGNVSNPKHLEQKSDAGVIIGDVALKESWDKFFKHTFDLGAIWKQETNLPFVFALWAVRKKFAVENKNLVDSIIAFFQESKAWGIKNIDEISQKASKIIGLDKEICKKYFNNICYDLNNEHIKGLNTFFDDLYKKKIIQYNVDLNFL